MSYSLVSQIEQNKALLENHSLLVTNTIQSIDDLQIFMEHHVYAVWDFMSLAKSLQHHICPSGNIWLPSRRQRKCSRLINEIILAEESDLDAYGNTYISHFDLYCQAMIEIGADISKVYKFIKTVKKNGIIKALESADIPIPSRQFMTETFNIIHTGNAHEIAAAFTYGRETILPKMFMRLLNQFNINKLDCPRLFYYLDRHIQVDKDEHGPAAIELVKELCHGDPIKFIEAESAAVRSMKSRIEFWNAVERTLDKN